MDIDIISPAIVAAELPQWRAIADARNHLWHGKALAFLSDEIDGCSLDLVRAVDGSLMRELGVAVPSVPMQTSQGPMDLPCSAVRLTLGREVDLGPLWQREELTDLFHSLLFTTLKIIFDSIELRMLGVVKPVQVDAPAESVFATGNYAYVACEDLYDPMHPLVHVIIPSITFAPGVGWLFLDPGFWFANRAIIETIVDQAMFDAYDRTVLFHGIGKSAQGRRSA